ncbi:sporulation protein YjcZ [Paenibacillus terrigena]|nr:sporulation protein YjcZ [Paenibacillus terrigena]
MSGLGRSFTSTSTILVLFILLVIVACACVGGIGDIGGVGCGC